MQRKKMGLWVLLGLSVAAGALAVRAQNQTANPYRARVKARFEALSQQINLSDSQKKSIAILLRQAIPQGQAIAKDEQLPNAQRQQRIKALRENTRAKIAAVLTPAQRQNVQELYAKRRQRMHEALEEIGDELQLSEKQRAEAKPVIEESLQKSHAVFTDASTWGQKRVRLVQLHRDTREKLASILSHEQMRKLDQLRDAVRAEAIKHVIGVGAVGEN